MSQETGEEISHPISEDTAGPTEPAPVPVVQPDARAQRAMPRRGLTRRALGLGVRGAGLIARLSARMVRGTFRLIPLPQWRHKATPLTPPVPVVTHTISALNVEVTLLGIDGKGPVYSVLARLKALSPAGHQRQVTAQAVQMAFQDQFAAHGETVTDVTTQAIIPALDDVQAWFVYARVTKQRGRRS